MLTLMSFTTIRNIASFSFTKFQCNNLIFNILRLHRVKASPKYVTQKQNIVLSQLS